MRGKQSLVVLLPLIMVIASFIAITGKSTPEFGQSVPMNPVCVQTCMSDSQISGAVRTLSVGKYDEQNRAVALLKADAERSKNCRQRVIANVSSAMEQPNLDLTGGTPQFFLWHYGTRLLGELKAVEALDLLIAHFHLHDGSGFPLDHHPAIVGVIDMGEVALPKLQAVLRDDPNPDTRQLAVFCIAQIGGQSARQILSEALPHETDKCIISCIRATLASFNNKRRPNNISDVGRTDWYTTFLCKGE